MEGINYKIDDISEKPFVAHENEADGTNLYKAFNWFLTLGQASGYMVATATRNGKIIQ